MSEFEIAIELFDFVKSLIADGLKLTEEQSAEFCWLRHQWNVLQGYEEEDEEEED